MDKALILIDIQKAFRDGTWGERNNEFAELNASKLLKSFRQNNDMVIHINHISNNPESRFYFNNAGFEFQEHVLPIENEKVISKEVNSAFIGTDLKDILDANGIKTLVIAGLSTPHCVSTTTRMAGNYGYETILVEDATASFSLTDHKGRIFSAQEIQDITIATLHDEFAAIKSTEELIGDLFKS
ncbi:cysteine hydrolase family protein [Floricoccus penangensis]|uniref:cysteine hydrolase family protein n=1 Tax=Floricoccus penangensis TaxID=1859475 RepID=UPI00203A61DF|nr:cysteine hydrolase family protein [Floricoccus penangensis]URZ86805.1 cysteine hydrolase [Floricoccus penangensis]